VFTVVLVALGLANLLLPKLIDSFAGALAYAVIIGAGSSSVADKHNDLFFDLFLTPFPCCFECRCVFFVFVA
jgi:hypothetical protein